MGSLHPQVVHFAIALLFVGVLFRVLSLLKTPSFVGPMAATLLLLGTIAAVVAAQSGAAAHGPVEAMPGARPAVEEHEEWGERARNVFLLVLAFEAVALVMRRSPKATMVYGASALVGLAGLFCLYEAGEHGGELVYAYAGGVGIRSGDPADVEHLLLAGLYQQALVDRAAGKSEDAAALMAQLGQRFPKMVDVQLAAAQSLLVDKKDTAGALEALRAIQPPNDARFQKIQHALLTADALEASGQKDGAIALLQQLQSQTPNPRVERRLNALKSGAAPPAR